MSEQAQYWVIAGWFVTAIGWLFANYQANRRENRKEVRAEVDRVISTVHDLLEAARDYYTTINNEREEARLRIHTLIARASRQIEQLDKHRKSTGAYPRFAVLFEAITDGNFESKKLKPESLSGERYARITAAAENYLAKVEEWFYTNKY